MIADGLLKFCGGDWAACFFFYMFLNLFLVGERVTLICGGDGFYDVLWFRLFLYATRIWRYGCHKNIVNN